MVNSICIKSNNNIVIQFLLNSLEKIDLNNVFVSQNKFKYYQNLIIHYRGPSIDLFYSKLADYLADLVISCYEKDLIKSMINCNYFYFDDIEKKKILNICNNTLLDIDKPQFYERKNIIFVSFLKYIIYNKYLVLDGFINFRLKDYISILDEAIDFSVNKFIIEKEFAEFVNLLKTYINSKKCNQI